jgi:transposase
MHDSVEGTIVELHFRRYRQDKITAAFHTGKVCVLRFIRHGHETGVIPGAMRLGRPRKGASELASFIEARTILSAAKPLSDRYADHPGTI